MPQPSSPETYSIGRDGSADIPIADDSVSRLHAQVAIVGPDELFVSDCGSTNGTWRRLGQGDEEIRQARVRTHETLRFGSVEIHARDLWDAIQRKRQPTALPPPPPARGAVLPHSTRLVRCVCGAVRNARERCVLCGEAT